VEKINGEVIVHKVVLEKHGPKLPHDDGKIPKIITFRS